MLSVVRYGFSAVYTMINHHALFFVAAVVCLCHDCNDNYGCRFFDWGFAGSLAIYDELVGNRTSPSSVSKMTKLTAFPFDKVHHKMLKNESSNLF